MSANRRRALLWLPNLDLSTLQWAANHPVHRTGLARWWQRSQASRYQSDGSVMRDIVWPHATLRWDDLALYLHQHADLAAQLRSGATVRMVTLASARDVWAVLTGLEAAFPATEVVIDLVVDNQMLLPAWLKNERFTIATLMSPSLSAEAACQAVVERRGVEISGAQKQQEYLASQPHFTAIIGEKTFIQPVLTILDDRHRSWQGLVGLRVSELLATRSPNLWQLLAGRSDTAHIAAHTQAPGLALHTAHTPMLQRYSDPQTVLAEVQSVDPDLLTVVAPPSPQNDWIAYDDHLALLLGQLAQQGYATLALGAPTTRSSKLFPVFYLGHSAGQAVANVNKPVRLNDVRDAVWSFAGVSDTPAWLLRDVLLS